MTDRGLAYQILLNIFCKEELSHIAIKNAFDNVATDENNKPFIKTLVSGVCEYYLSLGEIISWTANRPIEKIKPQLRIIISMGLYQGYFMNVPVSAACNESVKLAKKNGFTSLSGFVNGNLRSAFRSSEKYEEVIESIVNDKLTRIKNIQGARTLNLIPPDSHVAFRLSLKYSIPEYIVNRFLDSYGEEKTISILNAYMTKRKVTIVRMTSRVTKEELQDALDKDKIEYKACDNEGELYEIENLTNLTTLKAYKKGMFIVQDMASYLAGKAAPIINECKVLDMCSAPGGKLIHMADMIANVSGHALGRDLTDKKVKLVNDNIKRVGINNAVAVTGDATVYIKEDYEAYDLVLADVPCSGLGVIAKKPDIKYKTKEEDIVALAKIGHSILDNAMKYVKKGGYLLFSTCTLAKEENDDNASYIIENGFKPVNISKTFDLVKEDCVFSEDTVTILPTENHDGFFVSLFKKED